MPSITRSKQLDRSVVAVAVAVVVAAVTCSAAGVYEECLVCGLFSEQVCSGIHMLGVQGSIQFGHGDGIDAASHDFGGIVSESPGAVLMAASVDDISKIIRFAASTPNLTVAAYGNGHSFQGQAQALHGIVVNMSLLNRVCIDVASSTATAGGGALWIDLIKLALKQGLAPRSFTDYLDLTVGGTLSNAGISGQTHIFGPQISNVVQLQVVTGKGDVITCSAHHNRDLFSAVRGGLGQFGIITQATIILQPSHSMTQQIRLVYSDAQQFLQDQLRLINTSEDVGFDYIEGFVYTNTNDSVRGWPAIPFTTDQNFNSSLIPAVTGLHLYVIELAQYYNYGNDVNNTVAAKLVNLSYIRGLEFVLGGTFLDFLDRVRASEKFLRSTGVWYNPHPWLNLFVSAKSISNFIRIILDGVLSNGVNGPLLIYPFRIPQLWDPSTSAVLPTKATTIYTISLLKSTASKEQPLTDIAENNKILQLCQENDITFKVYLGRQQNQSAWITHFGDRGWARFSKRKKLYDPKHILAPGQNIFTRIPWPPVTH